jgi:hypothetical protein
MTRIHTNGGSHEPRLLIGGTDIDFISIDTDFDFVDEHSLVTGFIQDGTIPKSSKAKYYRRTDAPKNEDNKKH